MKKSFITKAVVWLVLVVLVLSFTACGKKPCEHNYVDGVCTKCNEADPNYVPHTHYYVNGVCSCGQVDANYDPMEDESYYTDLSVRSATGTTAAVASANAYASKAGYDILKAGGNAFDASVAMAFAIGVTEPYASGIGGGGVMTAYNASTGEYVFYNFREFIPGTGTIANYKAHGVSSIPTTGIYSAGVPTEVAGLAAITENLGRLSLAENIAPAIDLAENGFIMSSTFAGNIDFKNFRSEGALEAINIFSYENNGIDPLMAGDRLIQTDYANVLKEIAEYGPAGFYTGWVAQAIVEASESRGGFISYNDLIYAMENYPKIGSPIYTNYKGYDIYTANTPSSGGIILAEALNMLEHYQTKNGTTLAQLGHNSAEYVHVLGTALQLSFADKRQYIADNSVNPATGVPFVNVPIEGLANKEYAAQRFDALYNPNDTFKATSSYDFGGGAGDKSPWDYQDSTTAAAVDSGDIDDNGTTSFSVADAEGNIVSYTQTINHFWGSYIMPENCGFFLNDQLTSFSLTKTGPEGNNYGVHYVAPYKQPVSHIMPTIILKDGKPFATLGSPGSMRIPSAVTQVVLNLIDFEMGIQEAINAARIHSYCVQTADSDSMSGGATYKTHKLIYGEELTPEVVAQLSGINYYVYEYSKINLFFGGVQGITFQYDANGNFVSVTGGADPRRDGKALAY